MGVVGRDGPVQTVQEVYMRGEAFFMEEDYTAALPLVMFAANEGNRDARFRLGHMYDTAKGGREHNTGVLSEVGRC